MSSKDLFGDEARIHEPVKQATKNKQKVTDHKKLRTEELGLNSVYKDFGEYIKNGRNNKAL